MVVRTEEGGRRAQRVRGTRAFIANALPHEGRPRLDVGKRPSLVLRRDPDRRSAMATTRGYCDVATGHDADAERVDRAHGVERASIQCNPVACVPVSEG